MTAQPRSASVVCAADCGGGGCVVEEISGDDFARLLMARRTGFRRDVMRMLRARQFRHGVYKLLTELGTQATFSDQVTSCFGLLCSFTCGVFSHLLYTLSLSLACLSLFLIAFSLIVLLGSLRMLCSDGQIALINRNCTVQDEIWLA